ncbi:hypothetical protein EMPS_08552 [Entomortierella parvispora]|uniref:Uncharacterized protein n=1 Tax=Entomortierella parvispora TaxID=205924 RepID=A0A9P3LZH7_9FUNG|nr:hypothetical protein EMPS_08552 [Entomortierella parvispora]
MDDRLSSAKAHSHQRTKTFEQERLDDQRPIVSELQRELRAAMEEIEKLAQMSRDLAKINQELEESRLLAISDQNRTSKRLLLMSSQLEYTEQRVVTLTKELDEGNRDADQLRIERMRRETLQQREDASRLKIDTLEDELQECQRSERSLQQKLYSLQGKFETLTKRHENLKRQQQELELARESKEALAWLKETTDRLCSPPNGGLHMGIGPSSSLDRSFQGSGAHSLHQSSPSSSPPYPSSLIDPPLAAQNQLISLIKELATTNSTLRSELNEYRDLLQDSRNEVLTLRTQVEDYEQGHVFEDCCGSRIDDTASDSLYTSKSAWSHLDVAGGGLDAVSHIGTLGSAPGSPPPFMTAPSRHHHHIHRHFHGSVIRGNVFGELERLYSQGSQASNHTHRPSKRRTSQDHDRSRRSGTPNTTTGSTTSVSRKGSTPMMNLSRSPPNPTPSKLRDQYDPAHSPVSSLSRSRRSYYSDQDVRNSSEGSDQENNVNASFSFHDGHLRMDSDSSARQTRFVQKDSTDPTMLQESSSSSNLPELSVGLLPSAPMDEAMSKADSKDDSLKVSTSAPTTEIQSTSATAADGSLKNRASSISLLSAELQKATRTESKETGLQPRYPVGGPSTLHPFDVNRSGSNSVLDQDAIIEGHVRDSTATTTTTTTTNATSAGLSKSNRSRFMQHEKSASDQGWRQRRRLSEPLHHLPSSNSITAKKTRPGSIYSLRKPRPRLESPETNPPLHQSSLGYYYHPGHGHGHMVSGSVGCLPELQRFKSAEMVDQIVTERRHRMMEAWRVGVVAAAVTQQQSIHSVVAFGEHSGTTTAAKDTDNISIRSRASKASRRTKNSSRKVQQEPTLATIEAAVPTQDTATMMATTSSQSKDTLAEPVAESEIKKGFSDKDQQFQPTSPPGDTTTAQDGEKTPTFGAKKTKTSKAGKRMSVRSRKSVRSSILHSPMQRSPQQAGARDRRFPSEATTASEAFSNRRLDQEHSPYQLLHTLSTDLLERLARSDTRELNRRLRRTFDIQALSQMSNSVIENVLTDVNNLGERFRWVEAQVASPMDEMLFGQGGGAGPKISLSGAEMENTVADSDTALEGHEKGQLEGSSDEETDSEASMDSDWGFSVEEFFPLAHVVQEMLSEIGKLRMTINELQLSYVQKVEQDRIKAEKDFMLEAGSADDGGYDSDDEKEDGPYDSHHDHHHHHHHHLQHHDQRMEKDKKAVATAAAAAQHQKTVLGRLERPRILGAASTGVSGFFNKVFGGSEKAQPRSEDAKVDSATERDKDVANKNVLTKSKSGVVLAETSRIFAQSAWLSSPGDTKTPKRANTLESAGTSEVKETATSALTFGPSKLSATTSLAAMAGKTPVRSSTIAIDSTTASRIGAVDIRFRPGVRPTDISTGSTTTTIQGVLSRSLPQSATFMTRALEDELAEAGTTVATGESNNIAPGSLKSLSSLPEDRVTDPQTPPVTMGENAAGSSSQTPHHASNGISMSKTPRSMGISTRTSGPALNVVTKQDVFQEHWPSSLGSSLSATISSTTLSEKRLSSNSRETSLSTGGMAGEPNGRKNNRAPSMESHSSTSTGGEAATSSLASRLGVIVGGAGSAKPTLISRSTLAVATPSTSTVSSPMSATSWFDTHRPSGGAGLASDLQPSTETDGSLPSMQDVRGAINGTGGSSDQPVAVTTRKTRALTSFHTSAANGGSNESAATRSLGRAAGRESALAFLRAEGQSAATSLLGSFFQQPDNHHNSGSSGSSHGGSGNGVPTASERLRSSILKGKTPIYDSQPNSTKASFEILTKEGDDHHEEGEYGATEAEKDWLTGSGLAQQQQLHIQTGAMSNSRSDTSLLQATLSTTALTAPTTPLLMRVTGTPNTPTTPTTSITQRNAPTSSTAVAYVVAVPDHEEGGTGSGGGAGAGSNRLRRAVFDRDLIKASQKRILAQVPHHNPTVPQSPSLKGESSLTQATTGGPRPFEPQAKPRRARALSVDSSQSVEPLKATEIMDIWRVGAGVSRELWRGLIKKVDGRET